MAKTKVEKIRGIEEQIHQLENERKRLLQQHREQERKARTNRLCKRGGLLESMLPDTIALTDEQFQTFMEKTMLTPFTRRILDELTKRSADTGTTQGTQSAAQSSTPPAAKPPQQLQLGGAGAGVNEGKTARVSG